MYSMSNSNIYFIVVYIIIPIVILSIFYYLPKVIRTQRLSKLATEFSLSFDNNTTSSKYLITSIFTKTTNNRNKIEGESYGHKIEIYDSYQPDLRYNRQGSYFKSTHIFIDGKEQVLGNSFLNTLSPVSEIRKILLNLKNVPIAENAGHNFNDLGIN